MNLVRNFVRYLHGITNERNSEGRNSVFVRYSVQEPVRGELWFAANPRTLVRQGRTCSR